MKINIKNKDVKELMSILFGNNISNFDKKIVNLILKKRISYFSNNYYENISSLREFFSDLSKKKDLKDYLYDLSLPSYIKKYIIDYGYNDDSYSSDLLKMNISYDLKEYIVINKITCSDKIINLLKDDLIDNKLKKLCVKKNIDTFNIINIMLNEKINDDCRNFILSIKKNLFITKLFSTSKEELLYDLTFDYTSLDNVKFLEKYRPGLLKNLSGKITSKYIRDSFDKSDKNDTLFNIVITANKEEILKMVSRVNKNEVIKWLEVKNLPNNYIDIIINNNFSYLNEYIDKIDIEDIMKKISNYTHINDKFKELIINRRLDDLVKLLDGYDIKKYLKFISIYYYNDNLIINTIGNKITDNNVIDILNNYSYHDDIVNFLLKYKSDYITNILININWDNLLSNKMNYDYSLDIITSFSSNIQNKIYKRNVNLINEILSNYDKEMLMSFLDTKKHTYNCLFIDNIQVSILKMFNISDDRLEYCKVLLKYCKYDNVFDLINKIELFFDMVDINIGIFFQYSSYMFNNNLIDDIIDIVNDNELSDFIIVKNYFFNNYYSNTFNSANNIINFNSLIKNYKLYKNLLLGISKNNIILNDNDKNNLNLLFNGRIFYTPSTLLELEEFKVIQFKKFRKEILSPDTSIERLKEIFFDNFISFNSKTVNNIGSISSLRILQKDNKDNREILFLTEELIVSMDIINKIRSINNREELVSIIISYIDGKDTLINKMINNISLIDRKIRRLYELDSMYNLTTLESARKIPGIYNKDYMDLYGGEVFDFRNINYVLYAHVLSNRENIDDLVNGKSTGNDNFISFSPISYRGQKYYYDYCNCILAYDTILDNSFICSSLSNMGSNGCIKKNSAKVYNMEREQRGILETSSVKGKNAEALFYRENLKPCGIILVDGKKPNKEEIEYHKKYNLPFIITQGREKSIDNPRKIFESKKGNYIDDIKFEELDTLKNYISNNLVIRKENDIYTGREVAIFTDTHAMYEPTIAILEDIRSKGISEIYSLGDNTSLGPNPKEVLDLMNEYNVKQVMGNSEYYLTLGGSPFSYWDMERERSLDWTNDKVKNYINDLKLYRASSEILLGGKRVALCHFGNDIRWDYIKHNTWIYQDNIGKEGSAKQFLFTNSSEYNSEIEYMINKYGINNPKVYGYLSSKNDPLFGGKVITFYDDVFEGHVHFEIEDKLGNTNIHTLRGAGMGEIDSNKKNMAYYIILKEKKQGGFDIEKVFVPFNKNSLLSSIYVSDMPSKSKILSYLK